MLHPVYHKEKDMARIKLTDPVNAQGTISTPAQLLDQGRAIVSMTNNFYTRRGGPFTKYFVDLIDPATGDNLKTGWEISKFAYQSRIDQTRRTLAKYERPAEDKAETIQYPSRHWNGNEYQVKATKHDAYNWTCNVYLRGALWYEGDELHPDPDTAVHETMRGFEYWAPTVEYNL